jgi:hypothetical protein
MLEIQRWKTCSSRELRSLGLSEQEIQNIRSCNKPAFRPAFINGKRRRDSEQDACQSFYERFQHKQQIADSTVS